MIEIKAGNKHFVKGAQQVTVLDQIDLRINKGEFVSIMGRSGSGKSTLLHILGCMDQLSSGNYTMNGMAINQLTSKGLAKFRNEHLGFVFQSFYLIKEFTALQNVEVPMGYAGVPRRERKKRAMELLGLVNMDDKAKYYPNQLSGGQQQRVALARAMANKPEIVFADEPTGSLDTENGEAIMELLVQLHQTGTTLVLVTHDLELGKLAQKNIILENGRIQKVGN